MNAKTETDTRRKATPARRSTTRVVCGIDASRADETAVREACAIAGPEGHVALVCVVHSIGAGATAQATISSARATSALEHAMKQTRAAGVRSSVYLLRRPHAAEALLRAASDCEVLVVGTHGGSRAGGIALGGVATAAVHRASVPVLIARPSPADSDGSILIASDGSPGSAAACELGADVAARTRAPVALFTADHEIDAEPRHVLARQAVDIEEAAGRAPTVIFGTGRPVDAIVDAATQSRCALLVLGSSGRTGLKALGSVSERVVHRAPCSVLVARPKPS